MSLKLFAAVCEAGGIGLFNTNLAVVCAVASKCIINLVTVGQDLSLSCVQVFAIKGCELL